MNRENIVQDILESIPNMDSKNISKIIESYLVYDIYDRKDLIMVHFGVEHRYKEEDENDEEHNIYDFFPHTDCYLVYFIHLKEIAILNQIYCGRTINSKDKIFTTSCNETILPSKNYIFIKGDKYNNELQSFEKKSYNKQEFLYFLKCKELIYKKEVNLYGKDYLTYENYIMLKNEHIRLTHHDGGSTNDWEDIYDIFIELIEEVNKIVDV